MVLERGCDPSPENFGTFSLEMAHFGANSIAYFNRNVRQFTARPTTVTCILVLLAAEGGSIKPVEPPRYGPANIRRHDNVVIETIPNICNLVCKKILLSNAATAHRFSKL